MYKAGTESAGVEEGDHLEPSSVDDFYLLNGHIILIIIKGRRRRMCRRMVVRVVVMVLPVVVVLAKMKVEMRICGRHFIKRNVGEQLQGSLRHFKYTKQATTTARTYLYFQSPKRATGEVEEKGR